MFNINWKKTLWGLPGVNPSSIDPELIFIHNFIMTYGTADFSTSMFTAPPEPSPSRPLPPTPRPPGFDPNLPGGDPRWPRLGPPAGGLTPNFPPPNSDHDWYWVPEHVEVDENGNLIFIPGHWTYDSPIPIPTPGPHPQGPAAPIYPTPPDELPNDIPEPNSPPNDPNIGTTLPPNAIPQPDKPVKPEPTPSIRTPQDDIIDKIFGNLYDQLIAQPSDALEKCAWNMVQIMSAFLGDLTDNSANRNSIVLFLEQLFPSPYPVHQLTQDLFSKDYARIQSAVEKMLERINFFDCSKVTTGGAGATLCNALRDVNNCRIKENSKTCEEKKADWQADIKEWNSWLNKLKENFCKASKRGKELMERYNCGKAGCPNAECCKALSKIVDRADCYCGNNNIMSRCLGEWQNYLNSIDCTKYKNLFEFHQDKEAMERRFFEYKKCIKNSYRTIIDSKFLMTLNNNLNQIELYVCNKQYAPPGIRR